MRISRPLFCLMLMAAPTLAHADLLDRLQAATVAQTEKMQAFYVSRVPEIEPLLPDTAWTPEMEASAQCTLDGLTAARGEAGAEAYVAAMEAWAAAPMVSMAKMADGIDPILSDELTMKLAVDCGAMDAARNQAENSGVLEMLQRPDVMERLMAE